MPNKGNNGPGKRPFGASKTGLRRALPQIEAATFEEYANARLDGDEMTAQLQDEYERYRVLVLFRQRRLELGLTQQQAGERFGMSNSRIAHIEVGRGDLMLTTLMAYARDLGLRVRFTLEQVSGEPEVTENGS